MNALDYAKALGVALLLMVLNVAAAFGVMAIYGYLIDPGHEPAYYEAAAQRIAPWSSVFVGALLFFAAAWLFGVRRSTRHALMFALAFTAIYTVIDLSIIVSIDARAAMTSVVAISVLTKFAAAALGAWMARRA